MKQEKPTQSCAEEKREGISIETAKVIQGISLVFSGAVMMLEALHPHVSLEPSAVLNLVTGNIQGLEAMAAEKDTAEEDEKDETENSMGSGTEYSVPADPAADAAPVDDMAPPTMKEASPQNVESANQPEQASTVTQDDITKIIVQKIKQNRSKNEKIGAILKTYGVAKVSDLPASKYEAFLTDLSAI